MAATDGALLRVLSAGLRKGGSDAVVLSSRATVSQISTFARLQGAQTQRPRTAVG